VPIYEYQCEVCGHTFEVIQKFSDEPIASCVVCSGPVHRVLSPPALVFKGTGWYVTDYARAERKKATDGDKTEGEKKETEASSDKSGDRQKSKADKGTSSE
jgi:putative FmdB family regulatory protein